MSVIQSQELFKRKLGNLTHDSRKRVVGIQEMVWSWTPVRNLFTCVWFLARSMLLVCTVK